MLEHRRKHQGDPAHGKIHEVDRETYPLFCKAMRWKEPPRFGKCSPTLGESYTPRDARQKIINKRRPGLEVQVKSLRMGPPEKRIAKERRREPRPEEKNQGASLSRVQTQPKVKEPIAATVTSTEVPSPLTPAIPEQWRIDLLDGAAMLKQHVAQLKAQVQVAEAKIELWERRAREPVVINEGRESGEEEGKGEGKEREGKERR